ncbi:unnamed protein product, partial [Closterium sp. NIES-53]
IPPRKTAASYRADEWDINRWAWEGAISVVSRGDHCSIRLLDAATGDLFAHAPVRPNHPLPLEAVIDSSRFFVLRIEDSSPPPPSASAASAASASSSKGGKPAAAAAPVVRHAFIGLGFRERTAAYDFQAAVYDHVQYVQKQQEARRMGRTYDSRPAADYRLKDGQTLHLDLKTPARAKPSTAGLPLSPTTPGNVAFKLPSLTAAAPDASALFPMRQASGDHAAADSSPPHATAAATTTTASPPILPPPPPARLSSPPSASPSSPPSTSFSARSFPPAAPSPSIAWAFQSDDPPASVTSVPQSVMPATSGGSEGGGSAAAAGEDTDDFGEFVAA